MSETKAIYWTNEKRRLCDLIPWDINPATISKDAAKRLEESLDEFGQVQTIAISPTNEIYDGHQRQVVWGASQKFGANYEVDVRVSSRQLTEQERKKLVIYLRKGTVGEFDFDVLANNFELDDLLEWGFDRKELDLDLWMPEPPDDPGAQMDRAEELREKWGVESGKLWQLGEHRLICGDCTDRVVVERVMGGEKAEITFTSPPYWVGKDYEYQQSLQEVKEFINSICQIMASVTNKDGGRIIVNTSTASAKAINERADAETLFTVAWYQDAFRDLDWLMRHCRIWIKHGDMGAPSVAARSDVVDQHWEVIPEFLPTFYYPDGLRRGQEKIGMKWAQLGIWDDIPGERSAGGLHCAAFPLELPERYTKLYTKQGELIFDPFLGSGTTLIACERLGRRCRAIEISAAYCAVAIQRWVDMTGKEPVLMEAVIQAETV